MRNLNLLIITFLFISCSSSPLKENFNEKTFEKDIKLIKGKLSSEDFEILENTIIRLDFNREELEKMTYTEILESGKNQKKIIKKRESEIIQLVSFEKEKKLRFKKVIDKLIIIKDAELDYYRENGKFTDAKNELEKFIDKNKKDAFKVPYTNKEFYIAVDKVERSNNIIAPVFEVKIDKESVLKGLNPSLIRDEKHAFGMDDVIGEFISVGSLTEPSRRGNWPSFYEK